MRLSIPDLFVVNDDGHYTADINPGIAHWFLAGHGQPAPLYIGRTIRYTHADGWQQLKTNGTWGKFTKATQTAFDNTKTSNTSEGLWELVGPKLSGNPHGLTTYTLHYIGLPPGDAKYDFEQPPPRNLHALRNWLAQYDYQGIIWTYRDDNDATHYTAARLNKF